MQQAIHSVSQANTSMKKRGLFTTTTVTTIPNSGNVFLEPHKNKDNWNAKRYSIETILNICNARM